MWGSFIPYSMPVYPGAFGPPPEPFRVRSANTFTPEKGKLEILGPQPEEISEKVTLGVKSAINFGAFR
jgi:hypothetical protein